MKILGQVLSNMSGYFGSLGLGVLVQTLLLRLLMSQGLRRYYASAKQADELQDKVNKIFEKAKNRDAGSKKVAELFKREGYNSLGMIAYLAVALLITILVGLPLLGGGAYLTVDASERGLFNLIEDVCAAPYDVIREGNILGFLLPAMAVVTTYWHDSLLAAHSLVERKNFDSIVMIVVLTVTIFLPIGFALIWTAIELFGVAQFYLVMRAPARKTSILPAGKTDESGKDK